MEAAAAQTLVSVSTDHRQTVREACDAIRKALETSTRSKGMAVELFPFGSTISGFAVEEDCDVDLNCNCEPHPDDMHLRPEKHMKATVKRARDALTAHGGATKMVAILSARVPILKFNLSVDSRTAVPVDMCFNNLNGCRNSELLRRLASAEPRFRPLAMLIKLWAKRRGLVDSPGHFFSSYALVLLVARFLQQRNVLPKGANFRTLAGQVAEFSPTANGASPASTRQQTNKWIEESPVPETSAETLQQNWAPRCLPSEVETAIRGMVAAEPSLNAKKVFSKVMEQFGETTHKGAVTPKDIRALLASIKSGEPLTGNETVIDLLRAFFTAHAKSDAHKFVISLLNEEPTVTKQSKGWVDIKGAKSNPSRRYAIEDPLETDFDTARMLNATTMKTIRFEFSRADRILSGWVEGEEAEAKVVLAELLRSSEEENKAEAAADKDKEEDGEVEGEEEGEGEAHEEAFDLDADDDEEEEAALAEKVEAVAVS